MIPDVDAWRQVLQAEGIVRIHRPFSLQTVARWNEALDPLFAEREKEERSYVRADELYGLGILDELFRSEIRGLIARTIPDAVLLHCHAYEIAPDRGRPHVRGWERRGWHRDLPASRPDHHALDFVSFFLYLSDVGPQQAPFEVARGSFDERPSAGRPCIQVTGPRGTFFAWNRALLHRAAPNHASNRRRLLKLSIQHNSGPNPSVESLAFRRVREEVGQDLFLAYLFGGCHLEAGDLPEGPNDAPRSPLAVEALTDNAMVDLGPIDITVGWILDTARAVLSPFRPPPAY